MVRPHFMQRRAARLLSNSFTPGNQGEIGLFNDSGIAQILRVWLAFSTTDSGASLQWMGSFKGRLTNQNNGNVSQILVDEPRVPGRVDTQDVATAHTVDFALANNNNTPTAYGVEYPIAIIKPGWTFFVQSALLPAATVRAAMLWDWVFADELDEPLSDRDTFKGG